MAKYLTTADLYELAKAAITHRLGYWDRSTIRGEVQADDRGLYIQLNSGGNYLAVAHALYAAGYQSDALYATGYDPDEDHVLFVPQSVEQAMTVIGSRGAEYQVRLIAGTPVSCTCPDHTYRNNECKHMRQVEGAPAEVA